MTLTWVLDIGFQELYGIMPRVTAEDRDLEPDHLITDFDSLVNRDGVEHGPAVADTFAGFAEKGYFRFATACLN